ncbi:uncharacterized protein N7483_009563 [Penicillium malachiteum]|uniref:uncharacterized protein n=1 Tax=Penicillium malachiteum TaxID=1324776 RepID=UPI0025480486|nr:uncharacterized protein N7483_009563 [Penicillium malachiteum]KAJ5721629.1 hypothetical protein N7483_009563 [Penicillium malachiteum]
MRFLCFHGRGTNNQILETQLAALRHELGDSHTYDFVEGILPASLAPELVGIFPLEGAYYDYFSHESAESVNKALDDLSQFIALEGPYDGIIAFSIGAALSATYLIRERITNPDKPLSFKCAIFLCGGAPLDPNALARGEVSLLDPVPGRPFLSGLPTAHIWGRNDTLWGYRSERLSSVCDPEEQTIFLHDEGHAVPGARAKDALLNSVRAIRRTVGRAVLVG